ncbi:hypothetical protein [Dishui Lake phycodnavirus 3]|nr:hypothetical protein [Dishui Lake phycodnavirus 3]
MSLVGERETAHTGLDAEDVVVGREHVHDLRVGGASLEGDGDLGVVDAGEVARTGRLVFFRLEGERVRVHTRVRGTGVVLERLDLVEVLALLFLESVLTVEDQLERVERTSGRGERSAFFGPLHRGARATNVEKRRTRTFRERHIAVGDTGVTRVGVKLNRASRRRVGGEVPVLGVGGAAVVEAPNQFLDRVVVGQADLLGGASRDRVGARVLDLLDQVFVALLREAAALFGVEIHVVTPDLEGRAVRVDREIGRQVEVNADFVILQRDEGQVQPRIPIEEEQQREEHRAGRGGDRVGRHLAVRSLLGRIQVKLGVQTPPLLVVLVDALTTDGQLNILDGTFGHPARVRRVSTRQRHEVVLRDKFNVHVTDQVTVARNSHGHTAVVGGRTVDGLFNVFHREVRVTLVHSLEEGNLRVTRQVDILGAVRHELHETTGHFESFCTIY